MTDYQIFINALRKCAKEHENDTTFTGRIIVADLCRDTANLLEELEKESKIGHWISHYDEDAKEGWYECDRCHTERAFNTDYCPDCAAKMD